jgi:predicted outer membrane protein
MKCMRLAVLAGLGVLLSGGAAQAQGEAERTGSSPLFGQRAAVIKAGARVNPALFAPGAAVEAKRMPALQRDERRFLKDAAAAGRFEAEASRLALGKSSDANVRSFAATLINHHASASNELLYMLQARGMAPPMLGNDQRKTLNRLARLQGAKFDRAFMEEVGLRYQQEDVVYFEKASQWARDPQIKAWIDRNLPTLRYHLATAERVLPEDARLAKSGTGGYLSRASLATQSMGAAPARLGTAKVKPIASSTR